MGFKHEVLGRKNDVLGGMHSTCKGYASWRICPLQQLSEDTSLSWARGACDLRGTALFDPRGCRAQEGNVMSPPSGVRPKAYVYLSPYTPLFS